MSEMQLFEATNGLTGESYVRRYVWAEDARQAELLVRPLGPEWDSPQLRIRALFRSDAEAFVTEESDSGFERPHAAPMAVNIRKDMYRQFVDGDDDAVIWLRLPDAERVTLLRLLHGMSLNDLVARGLSREEALKLTNLGHALY
jgi:hypothetical protein